MKLRYLQFIIAVMVILRAGSSLALIVLGDSGGESIYTAAPEDDPGWDNIGYVRANWSWNDSRASGVYIGDGWVLTSYHVIYFDAPTGIVFNAEPDKAYPVDVTSYVRLNTNSYTRLAASTNWIDPRETEPDPTGRDSWKANTELTAPEGADIAMFRLTEHPGMEPVRITELSSTSLSTYLNWFDNNTTAIATGRPRLEERSYWTTNQNGFVETTDTNAPYSGYKDWPDITYNPICRWGKNKLYSTRTPVNHPPFGTTICLPAVFNNYASGGTSNTFQMARLDSGGGVFYKGTGKWSLLGMLTAKQLPGKEQTTIDTTLHPFGSLSLICDLTRYREQIMRVTQWPDFSVKLSADTNEWLKIGQPSTVSIVTSNNSPYASLQSSTNTVLLTKNDQTNETRSISISSLNAGEGITNTFTFTPHSPATWNITVAVDSEKQAYEIYESNNQASETFYTGPDLLITHSTPATTNAAAGSTVSIDFHVQNQGRVDITNSFEVGFYCVTPSGVGIDTPVQNKRVSALPAGTSTNLTATFDVPTDTGKYYLAANADDYDSQMPGDQDAVEEADEENNSIDWDNRQSYSLMYVGSDLSISFSKTDPHRVIAGSTVPLDVIIRNTGGDPATGITNTLQLGTDSGFSTSTNVATKIIATLTEHSEQTNTFTCQAPTDPGTYYLRAQTDATHAITEFNENNNTSHLLTLEVSPLAMPWLNLLLE